MATTVPAPVLDPRSGDQTTAQSIGSLPAELSDRSNADPAVVILEASGNQFDKLLYQLNRWPSAVIQKTLNLIGVTLIPAQAATVTQTFTLSAPQPSDTVIPTGTNVSTSDGSITFATLSDLTISAYVTGTGTITLGAGSTAVTGSGTSFTTQALAGYQISVDKSTWYTVASVASDTSLTLSSSALSTVSGSAFYAGPITGTVSAQATTTGSNTSVAAATLTSLSTAPAGVSSTTNAAAASGGADIETTTNAIARAPQVFSTRDMATSASDYAQFAANVLGTGGRAIAKANTNGTSTVNGYVSIGMLSPSWTTTAPVSTQERASVVRDANGRSYVGATIVDVAAHINTFTTAGAGNSAGTMFACALYRKSAYDATTANNKVAAQINTYLSPNTYTWGRTIDPMDLVGQVESLSQYVDHVAQINGVAAVGMNYTVFANNATFTNGSTSVTGCTASDTVNATNGQTFLIDSVNNAIYLLTAGANSTTLTITPAFAGATNTFKPGWFTSTVTLLGTSGNSNNDSWYSLPYSALSVSSTSPASSIVVVGSV